MTIDKTTFTSSYLFASLNSTQREVVLSLCKEMSAPKDTYLIQEGGSGNEIYLLLEGEVEVIKKDKESAAVHQIATLGPGDIIGEISLVDKNPRSTSVRTLQDSKLLIFSPDQLLRSEKHKSIYEQIILNISNELASRLRKTSEVTVEVMKKELESSKLRVEMGRFLFSVLVASTGWIFFLSVFEKYVSQLEYTASVSFPVILLVFLICTVHVFKSQYPLSIYGLTLKNWKKYAWEGVLFSIPLIIAATFLKLFLVQYVPGFENEKLIVLSFDAPLENKTLMIAFVYFWLTIPQEFIARGGLQSSIYMFFSGPYNGLRAIFLSNIVFASFHSFLSPIFAVVAFFTGVYWGFIYLRHKSLVGCSVCHALVGTWSLVVLGFDHILLQL